MAWNEYTLRIPKSTPPDVKQHVIAQLNRYYVNVRDNRYQVQFLDDGKPHWVFSMVQSICKGCGMPKPWRINYYNRFLEESDEEDLDEE